MKADYHFETAKLLSNLEANLLVQANAIAQRVEAQWYEEILKDSDKDKKKPEDHPLWRCWRHACVVRQFIMSGNTVKAVEEAKVLFKEITS